MKTGSPPTLDRLMNVAGSASGGEIVGGINRRSEWSSVTNNGTENANEPEDDRRKVRSIVALTLLETIKSQDLPPEVLEDENVSITIPRRLGLSDVVETQIRRYREEVRRRRRITDAEARDLMRLVVRRPDSDEVFLEVGRRLAAEEAEPRRWARRLPRRASYALGRRRIKRRLRHLFGRSVGRFASGFFAMEGETDLFLEGDPGGDACEIVSGYCGVILEAFTGTKSFVLHEECRGRGGGSCRWSIVASEE